MFFVDFSPVIINLLKKNKIKRSLYFVSDAACLYDTLILCFTNFIITQHGELVDVRLVTYKNGASKGMAYIHFRNEVGVRVLWEKCNSILNNVLSFSTFVDLRHEHVIYDMNHQLVGKNVSWITFWEAFIVFTLAKQSDAAKALQKTDGMEIGDKAISVAISNPPVRGQPQPKPQADRGGDRFAQQRAKSLGGGSRQPGG